MNCDKCGAPLRASSSRCEKCGSAIDRPEPAPPRGAAPPPLPQAVGPLDQLAQATQPIYLQIPGQAPIILGPPKSKAAAALFALFLGVLGVHNFYLGATGLGVVQLLLTALTCGFGLFITVPWAFIDFICILTGSRRDRFGRPLA